VSDAAPANILTVDVEDWFHILEIEGGYTRADWPRLESRVAANTDRLLAILAEHDVRATFFVVGWVARRHPDLVRRIVAAGHEIASHSWWHEIVGRHSRQSAREDLAAARALLEDLAGSPVTGFRAPGNSVGPAQAWVFDVLVETGHRYDASISPGFASHGGFPHAPLAPHRIRCAAGEIDEIPMSTVGLAGRRFPYAGGGWLRLFPYPLLRAAARSEARAGRPTCLYLHPREIDPGQPRMALPALRRFKYYVGLSGAEAKLRALLRDFRWLGARDWLAGQPAAERPLFDVREQARAAPPDPDPALVPPAPEPA